MGFFSPKIIKFEDDSYAIKKRVFRRIDGEWSSIWYLDLDDVQIDNENCIHWRTQLHSYCKTKDLDKLQVAWKTITKPNYNYKICDPKELFKKPITQMEDFYKRDSDDNDDDQKEEDPTWNVQP